MPIQSLTYPASFSRPQDCFGSTHCPLGHAQMSLLAQSGRPAPVPPACSRFHPEPSRLHQGTASQGCVPGLRGHSLGLGRKTFTLFSKL